MDYSKDQVKEAFQKVKTDMGFLNKEIKDLKYEIEQTRTEISKICEILEKLTLAVEQNKKEPRIEKTQKNPPKIPIPTIPTQKQENQTVQTQNSTLRHISQHIPTQINKENEQFSTGNEGVPTDRQTHQQTDRQIKNTEKLPIFTKKQQIKTPIEEAAKILDSLDSLKKEVRIKFKQLTDQEVLVFSTLYQMEEETGPIDYKTLANKLGLTESSIRDYIGRLLKKGIPVEKHKKNNKQILLSISPNLKKVASLSTILQLRDI